MILDKEYIERRKMKSYREKGIRNRKYKREEEGDIEKELEWEIIRDI